MTKEEKHKKQLEASKRWKHKNKEKVSLYQKEWSEKNYDMKKEFTKQWKNNNKEKVKQYQKDFKEKNTDYFKNKHLKYSYGIGIDEYKKMLYEQECRCAVCGTHADETSRKKLFVDHSHATGKIRALLCQKCNTALGMVNEKTEILYSLISYLNEHRK